METKSFSIKSNGQKQYFEIQHDGIWVDLNTAKHKLQYKIPYDQINGEIHTEDKPQKNLLGLLLCSVYFNLVLVLCLIIMQHKMEQAVVTTITSTAIIGVIAILNIFKQETLQVHVKADKHLYFIQTKKNKTEIENFIQQILEAKKQFFRANYFKLETVLPYDDQLQRFVWLYQNKYISENEFEVIKEALDMANTSRRLGF